MDEEQDQDQRAQWLKLWHEYGKAYNVFVPADQPDLSFLRAASGATRVYPEWNTMTSTGRIYASRPAV